MQALFVKVDCYVKIFNNQGKILWRSVSDVPPDCISNMDKVATNAHNHRKKVIADRLHFGRLFQEVNASDNKMPMHISLCITSQPTGKF